MAGKTCDDSITLSRIKIPVRIGTTPEERAVPQDCEADLTVWGDFRAAATADSLEKSVDYCRIVENVRQIAAECEYNLVETLAYAIVRNTLQSFAVNRARIRLRKRPAGLLEWIEHVEIEVEEQRS
jgi:7,8-dihydroneopterin aldolase/epimerase/oxygenase